MAPDSLINFDNYFNGLDKWVKAEITQVALERARNNDRNLNLFAGPVI